jgi:hypothetical protein
MSIVTHAEMESLCKNVLWHHTDWEGLAGILRNWNIWATNYQYLNDESEVTYATQFWADACAGKTNQSPDQHILSRFAQPYVTSFTAKFDSLLHWRGYRGVGQGFALGFDQTQLSCMAMPVGGRLQKCDYVPKEHKRIAEEIAAPIREINQRIDSENPRLGVISHKVMGLYKELGMRRSQPESDFFSFAPAMKHPGFREEEEWRLICMTTDRLLFRFRQRGSMTVPYMEVPLPEASDGVPDVKALSAIMVGPGAHKSLNVSGTYEFLQTLAITKGAADLAKIPVSGSDIPYRDW